MTSNIAMRRYIVRAIGADRRGTPRVYLDIPDLAEAGFTPGRTYRREVDPAARRVTLSVEANGTHVVSRKPRAGKEDVPVIDIANAEVLKPFEGMEAVRIVIADNVVHILPLASGEARRVERLDRLASHLADGHVNTAATSFGGGVLDHAAHAGLHEAGVEANLVFANDIDEPLLEHAREHNEVLKPTTLVAAAPMQELVQDEWAMRKLPHSDIFALGIPCSGASRAGKSKRGLAMMENHPQVGHLIASAIQLIHRFNPAVVVVENVTEYADSASAQILRQHLRDCGYEGLEIELNSGDFGCLEHRARWFYVGVTRGIELNLENLAPTLRPVRTVAEILDPVPPDSEEWRTFSYLVEKEARDAAKGNGFGMQIITPESTKVPCLRAGYHKGGSTDPLLAHPTDPTLRRLLTVAEHAKAKDIPVHLAEGMNKVHGHHMLGQSVAYTVVRALFKRIGESLQRWATSTREQAPQQIPYSLKLATG